MGFLKPDKPKAPKPPPLPDEGAIRDEAERLALERRRKRRGRAGTILTSAVGATEEPTILTNELLGS